MSPRRLRHSLPDAAATAALGRDLAATLAAGDTLLLEGEIGAGKTHLARALIRARRGAEVEVPSPTYTLVQTYPDGCGEIWHVDLYRLGDPSELDELGLADAFGRALCLVEWPDRLGDAVPPAALRLALAPDDAGGRTATLTWSDARWDGHLGAPA